MKKIISIIILVIFSILLFSCRKNSSILLNGPLAYENRSNRQTIKEGIYEANVYIRIGEITYSKVTFEIIKLARKYAIHSFSDAVISLKFNDIKVDSLEISPKAGEDRYQLSFNFSERYTTLEMVIGKDTIFLWNDMDHTRLEDSAILNKSYIFYNKLVLTLNKKWNISTNLY